MAIALYEHVGSSTEKDFLALPDTVQRLELLEGTLLVNPPPSTPHQVPSINFVMALRAASSAQVVVVEARTADRLTKPAVYALAGIPSYWGSSPRKGRRSLPTGWRAITTSKLGRLGRARRW